MAGTYSPESLGIKPTTTGGVFKQGAWYNGRQFWGGTLSDPGVIHPSSNQQGAGQAVSNEVIAQTNPANVPYIEAQRQKVSVNAAPAAKTQAALDNFSSNLFSAANGATSPGVQTLDEIAKSLKDSGLLPNLEDAPTAPSMIDTYTELAEQKGVDAIQATINTLKAEQDEIAAQLRTNVASERGKPVATNVIAGRISEQERVAREDYEFVGRQLTRKQDELTTALGSIKLMMDLTQQDYTNAAQAYATRFTQAMSVINLIQGIQQDQKTDAQRATDNARANLQIMVNTIKEGNMDLSSLAPDQQAQLNKLEVQAGLPVGFIQSVRMDPKANIISTSTSNGITQLVIRNPDGTIGVQSYGTATDGGAGSSTASLKKDVAAKMTLDQVMKKYGNTMSPDTILEVYNDNSPFGKAKESVATLAKKYNVTAGAKSSLSPTDQANLNQVKDDIKNGLYTRDEAVRQYPEYAQYL